MKRRALAIAAIATAIASSTAVSQEPTRSIRPGDFMPKLAGTWSFEMFARGRDYPYAKGQREMKFVADSTKLLCTEEFDGSPITNVAIMGYDERFTAFYLMSVHTDGSTPTFILGYSEDSTIVWNPARTSEIWDSQGLGTYIVSELHLIDANHFEWVADNGAWRVQYTRVRGA
jgi:hypothetical protein